MVNREIVKEVLISIFLPSGIIRALDADRRHDKAMKQLREAAEEIDKPAIVESADGAIEDLLKGFENDNK